VRIEARLDQHDVDSPRAQLDPQGVGDGGQSRLRGGKWGAEGETEAIPDRANVHHPAASGTQQRQEGLDRGAMAEHIDLVDPAQVVDADCLHGSEDPDASVVDQPGQPPRAHSSAHLPRRGGNGFGVGDLDGHRGQPGQSSEDASLIVAD